MRSEASRHGETAYRRKRNGISDTPAQRPRLRPVDRRRDRDAPARPEGGVTTNKSKTYEGPGIKGQTERK